MNTIKAIAIYRRLREKALWRLLAADNGPAFLALLQAHLLEENRTIPASVLFERLGKDLEDLRAQGEDLPQAAQAYVSNWLAAGYLTRRFPAGASEEEYELTAATAGALRFINGLIEHRSTATESRLSTVIQQLVRLAEETETDPERRVAALRLERERIDKEIEAVQRGRIQELPEERALERIRDTIGLAGELADDFRNVHAEFEQLNRELRERIMDDEKSRGEVLNALFAGVDLIAESEAGRTFNAFWRLLTDPEQSATLEEALDRVLSRKFSGKLQPQERRFLLRIIPILLEHGGMVHDVLQHFARSLKQFVQSREYLEQRRINQLIKEAQRTALLLKENLKTTDSLHHALQLSTTRLRSVDQWVLYDPSLNSIERGVMNGEASTIELSSIGELIAHSEINFQALKQNICTALEDASPVTISQILDRFPAAQGLGSLIGYLALGSRHGIVTPEQSEVVSWKGEDGPWRRATIPIVYFIREKPHEYN